MGKRFWIFTSDHSGLPLAVRLQDEGYNVVLVMIRPEEREGKWQPPKDAKEAKTFADRVRYLDKNGKGLVEKMWSVNAMPKIGRNDYVIWDQIFGYQLSESLHKRGIKVFGGLEIGYVLETQRQKTLSLLGKMGFDLPYQKTFGKNSVEKAIQFLEKEDNERLYVLKSNNPACVTYVADYTNDELIQKFNAEKNLIDKDDFILQERVDGIEYNIETLYVNGKPVMCNIDLEEKRKFNNESKCQIGCAWDQVWILPVDHPLRERINKPFDQFCAKYINTGLLDVSVIHVPKEDKIYALEVCGSRFGYNQIYTLLELLTIPIGEYFASILDGKFTSDIGDKVFSNEFGTSLRVMNDECVSDSPITFPKELKKHYWIWDYAKRGGQLLTVGTSQGEALGIITASADTPEGSFAKIREYYRKLYMTSLYARDDYQDDETITLPLARYHELKKLDII